jgi:hypothetical protein
MTSTWFKDFHFVIQNEKRIILKKMEDDNIFYLKKEGYKNLILKTCLVIFLLLITYIAYFGFYTKKYLPVRFSAFQYSAAKAAVDPLKTNTSIENRNVLTYASDIGQCPPGQCVINISSGVKRCPQNTTNKLTYDTRNEACTRLDYCDYKKLPYAVNTNGKTTSNACEPGPNNTKIPCRCVADQTCSNHILTKFTVASGTANGSNQGSATKSFTLKQDSITDVDNLGYSNITINDTSEQFCKINPGFTDVLVDGCTFLNSSADKLGCEFIESVSFDTAGAGVLEWLPESNQNPNSSDFPDIPGMKQYVENFPPVSTSGNIEIGMRYLVISRTFSNQPSLPKGGFIRIQYLPAGSTDNPVFEVFKYSGTKSYTDLNSDGVKTQYIVLTNIVNMESSSAQNIQNSNGFTISFPTTTASNLKNMSLLQEDIVSSNCLIPGDQPNYKNMLLCTQPSNQPCTTGSFAYNFDKLRSPILKSVSTTEQGFTRNFCQLNQGGITNSNPTYLEDPTYYTLACSIGSGCGGKVFQKDDTVDIEIEARSKYFPEVDINGINGIWEISTSNFPMLDMKNTNQLLNNNNIQAGDFWSVKTINQTLISSVETDAGLSTIQVQDLFGLGQYVNSGEIPKDIAPVVFISGTSYRLTESNYTYNSSTKLNTSSIGISPVLTSQLDQYSPINIVPPNLNSLDSYGIVVTGYSNYYDSDFYQLFTLEGDSIGSIYDDLEINLTIFKQFSFSGANYTTKVSQFNTIEGKNTQVEPYGNTRQYTTRSGENFLFQYPEGSEVYTTTKRPPQNTSQLDFPAYSNSYREQAMTSSNVPFRVPMSMYYPVWNPALYQEDCIRCKPLLMAYPEISTTENTLDNIIIQFSGKDFGNYEYNAKSDNYCYVTTSKLDPQSEQTTQRIVLDSPNPNVRVGDYVMDSLLQFDFEVVPSSSSLGGNTNKEFNDLMIVPQIFPTQKAMSYYISTIQGMPKIYSSAGLTQSSWLLVPEPLSSQKISFGVEESTSSQFSFEDEIRYPSRTLNVVYDSETDSWGTYFSNIKTQIGVFDIISANYFFGKKYQDPYVYFNTLSSEPRPGIDTDGFYFVPIRKVTAISEDKKTFTVSSQYPETILKNTDSYNDIVKSTDSYDYNGDEIDFSYNTLIQFCRLDEPLNVYATDEGGTSFPNTSLKINAMSDSRITDIIITENGDKFLPENPPLIKLSTENQNFS